MQKERTIIFNLFRLVLEPNAKYQNLGELSVSRVDIVKKALNLSPQYSISPEKTYIMSKVSKISDTSLYFKFGIQKRKNAPVFDDNIKDFIQAQREDVDYVNCIYNIELQLLAVESNSSFGKSIAIAKNIANAVDSLREDESYKSFSPEEKMIFGSSTCKARIVYEPSEFIKNIRNAYKVTSFKVSILPPNPINFNDAIKKPLDEMMADTGASGSFVSVQNKKDGLDVSRLISLSHEVSRYGIGAEAMVQDREASRPQLIRLNKKSNLAHVEIDVPQTMFMKDFSEYASDFEKDILNKFRKIDE